MSILALLKLKCLSILSLKGFHYLENKALCSTILFHIGLGIL